MRQFLMQWKYFTLMTLKQKESLFWMLVFPIFLCSLFYFGFSKLDQNDLDFKLGLERGRDSVEGVLKKVPLFELESGNLSELESKLKEGKIDAFLNNKLELVVLKKNQKTEIIASILEEFKRYSIAYLIKFNHEFELGLKEKDLMDYELHDIADLFESGKLSSYFFEKGALPSGEAFSYKDFIPKSYLRSKDAEGSILKIVLFTTLAMFSLNGIYIAVNFITLIQGYLSPLGIRISASPYKKGSLVGIVLLSGGFLNILFNLILHLYLYYVLGIKLFSNLWESVPIFLAATFFGLCLGILLGSLKKLTEIHKTNITTAVLLMLSFMCGMSGSLSFKQTIETNFPILNRINFVNLVSEAFYQVNIIGDFGKAHRNLYILLAETLILLLVAIFVLRRESYDSL